MNALEEFALSVLVESRDSRGDIDGGWIQDEAETLGILVRVPVNMPCGEDCNCAEYGDFPQDCLRFSEHIFKFIKQRNKGA